QGARRAAGRRGPTELRCDATARRRGAGAGAISNQLVGVLLAAGAGRRFGQPKALARVGGQSLVRRGCEVLAAGGCARVHVVVGAHAEQVRAELRPGETAVYAPGWETGKIGRASCRDIERNGVEYMALMGRKTCDAAMIKHGV